MDSPRSIEPECSTAECSTAILGGGPAGLAVGYYLSKLGIQSHIVEAESTVGGACRTMEFAGVRYDLGAHRLHNVFPEVTQELRGLLGHDLAMVNVPSHIYHNDKPVPFPPSPLGLVRALGFWKVARSIAPLLTRTSRAADNFRDDAVSKYGRCVAESFLINFSEKLWGLPAEQLSVAVSGKRLQGLDARTALSGLLGRKHGEHLDGAFFYPRRGFGQITDALAAHIRHIHTEARVAKLLHANRRISEVVLSDGRRFSAQTVVCSLPVSSLVRMLDPEPPQSILDLASTLRFRSVRLAIWVVKVSSVSRSASLYFPRADVPFTRIYEPKRRSAAMAPADRTCLVVEYPVSERDPIDTLPRDAFLAMSREALLSTRLVSEDSLLEGTEQKIPNAYPVLDVGAANRLTPVEAYLQRFTNLHRIGRTACFEYTHLHDLMRAGRRLAESLAPA